MLTRSYALLMTQGTVPIDGPQAFGALRNNIETAGYDQAVKGTHTVALFPSLDPK